MSPKEAKVFIAEDYPDWVEKHQLLAERAGHQVIVVVNSLKAGLAAISKAKEQQVNVAILDGQLIDSFSAGQPLADALRAQIPEIKIIDASGLGDVIKDADARMPKSKYDITKFGQMITDL